MKLKCVEIALLLSLSLMLIGGARAADRQDALSEQVIRLHIIANSDSSADQALKLKVRDAVLAQASECLQTAGDRTEAEAALRAALPRLEETARTVIRDAGEAYAVSARLEPWQFPTRYYDGFALPGGTYLSVRLIIGSGEGHNWWCVVFPSLCTAAAADLPQAARDGGMEASEIELMEAPYTLKFRTVELWQQLRAWLRK